MSVSGSDTHADTREIAADVLASRREHDVCNRNECCYPTLPILAESVLALVADRDRERARADRAEAALAELRSQLSAAASLAHSSMIAAGDSATGKMFYNGRYHAFHDAILMQDALSAGSGGREPT